MTFLIDRGADVDRKNHDGLTALDLAKDDDMEELLLTLKVPHFFLFLTVLRLLPRRAAPPCRPAAPRNACGRSVDVPFVCSLQLLPFSHICACIPSCPLHTMPPSPLFTPCFRSCAAHRLCRSPRPVVTKTPVHGCRSMFPGHASIAGSPRWCPGQVDVLHSDDNFTRVHMDLLRPTIVD